MNLRFNKILDSAIPRIGLTVQNILQDITTSYPMFEALNIPDTEFSYAGLLPISAGETLVGFRGYQGLKRLTITHMRYP